MDVVMGEIPWLAVVAAILSSIAWTMFMYRMRKGSYRVVGTTSTAMLFKTSVGEFRLDKKNARLQVRQKQGNWTAVDASQILYKIEAVRRDGTYIVLFEASQLEEREFWLWGWWVRFVRSIFEYLNLIKDVENHSENVFDNLKNEFRSVGVVT